MSNSTTTEPSILIIFGATGDLSRRKLLPALGRLASAGKISERCHVLGVALQSEHTDDSFRELARESMAAAGLSKEEAGALCSGRLHYQRIGQGTPEDFRTLAARLESLGREHDVPSRCSGPPSFGGPSERSPGPIETNSVHHGHGLARSRRGAAGGLVRQAVRRNSTTGKCGRFSNRLTIN